MVVRRIAWLVFIGAATPLDTTPSVRKVNRPQHFGLTWLEFPGRDPALWDALGYWSEPTTPGPSRRVHRPILAPRSASRNTDSATHNRPPKPPQSPHNPSPSHPQVPHFRRGGATLVTTPGLPAGHRRLPPPTGASPLRPTARRRLTVRGEPRPGGRRRRGPATGEPVTGPWRVRESSRGR